MDIVSVYVYKYVYIHTHITYMFYEFTLSAYFTYTKFYLQLHIQRVRLYFRILLFYLSHILVFLNPGNSILWLNQANLIQE